MSFRDLTIFMLVILVITTVGCSGSSSSNDSGIESVKEDQKKTNFKNLKPTKINEWPPNKKEFRVYFFTSSNMKHPPIEDVLAVANEWSPKDQTLFIQSKSIFDSDIRISFYGKEWSKIANEVRTNDLKPTMELGFLNNANTISYSSRAKILHEFGHALGLVHGHQLRTSPIIQLDIEKLMAKYTKSKFSWVKKNFFIKYIPMSRMEQFFDEYSIMNYEIPQELIHYGIGTKKYYTLSPGDKSFVAQLYSHKTI